MLPVLHLAGRLVVLHPMRMLSARPCFRPQVLRESSARANSRPSTTRRLGTHRAYTGATPDSRIPSRPATERGSVRPQFRQLETEEGFSPPPLSLAHHPPPFLAILQPVPPVFPCSLSLHLTSSLCLIRTCSRVLPGTSSTG